MLDKMYDNRKDLHKKETKIDVIKYAPQPKQQVLKQATTFLKGKTKRRRISDIEEEQGDLTYIE